MEGRFVPVWSEESEMIANLQSMFWSNGAAADFNLPSPNTSDSCVTTSTTPGSFPHIESEVVYNAASLENAAVDWCLVHQTQTVTVTARAVAGDKRMFPNDELRNTSKNTNKNPRTIAQVSVDDEADTHLANQNSSWCCSSEDDSNSSACQETVALKQSDGSSSRGRSSRSSKNSQSLYAKRRRERINEKLRVLQQLVPNGTKVDISTMLEEAVEYVKFLQLQIKLLSCDETWMYAPLAHNGDLGATANNS